MKTLIKYLKDEGGQFWGAFAQSYAQAHERAKDRPMKEAMMKAQTAHQQAIADKAQMDIQQEREHQAALTNLTTVLSPQTVSTPTEGPATEEGVGPAPVTTTKMPDMKSPEVQSALVRAQPKEAATQMLKQLGPSANKFGVDTLEEAQQMEQDPNFRNMFSHGWRWETKNGKLVPSGINPVNAADNAFHTVKAKGGSDLEAAAARNAILYGGSASTGAGGVEGKAAQQLGTPIAPQVPFAQPPGGTPQSGAVQPAAAGGTNFQQAERAKKTIAREEAPLPEGLAKQQRDYVSLLNTTIADIEGNFDEKFLGARGVPGAQSYRESFLAPKLESITGVSPAGEKEVVFRKALADAKDRLLRVRSGAQINEQEAKRLAELLPAATDHPEAFRAGLARFKNEVQQSIANGKLFANVSRSQLEGMGEGEKKPTPLSGGADKNIINYNGKKYIKQNGALFEVRD